MNFRMPAHLVKPTEPVPDMYTDEAIAAARDWRMPLLALPAEWRQFAVGEEALRTYRHHPSGAAVKVGESDLRGAIRDVQSHLDDLDRQVREATIPSSPAALECIEAGHVEVTRFCDASVFCARCGEGLSP